jgi:cation:H+ antiporter
MTPYIFLVIGLVILVFGGDIMVRGAVGLAEKLNIPHLIIGLTIVAIGTSAPELFVSLDAAMEGAGGLAVGNIVGSNIANVLAVLGVPAIIATSAAPPKGVGRNIIFMLVLSVVFLAIMLTGQITRLNAIVLLGFLLVFLFLQFRDAKSGDHDPDDDIAEVGNIPTDYRSIIALLVFGLIGLQVGAQLIVGSSTDIARTMGVSDAIIGVTIVAIGTSLPELGASVMAAIKGQDELAIGNVVGSNIFNIAAILGITALFFPLDVDPHLLRVDIWVMLAAAGLLGLMYMRKLELGRVAGIAMSGAYVAYLVVTFMTA